MSLEGSPTAWANMVRPYADPGLATCLSERRLCRDGTPLPVSRLDVEALSLAEWVVKRRRTLILCPADPLAPLPTLIAATVHVADMAEQYTATHVPMGSRRRVAVVSTDYHGRGLYRGLGVRPPRSMGAAPLRDVVPAATLGQDGAVRVLGRDPGRGWATVFLSSLSDLRDVGPVDLVVVEMPVAGGAELLGLGVPVVVLVRDPADPILTRLAPDTLMFGWGEEDLARVRDDPDLPPRLARRAAGGRCEVVSVPAQAVCENAALFWQDVGGLVRSAGRSMVGRELAREAFTLFHDLVGLALPTEAYERMGAPLQIRLNAIGASARLTRGETRDLFLPMVEAELRGLAEAGGDSSPKHEALRPLLGRLLDDHRDVLLIARTAQMARSYESELVGDRSLSRVRVTSLGALADEPTAEVAVMTGMAPTWARWVYRCGVAPVLHVLAYAPETVVGLAAEDFDEVELVRRVVADQRAREAWLARPAAKARTWSQLSGERVPIPDDDHAAAPRGDSTEVPVVAAAPHDVPPGLWDGRGWLAPLEPGGAQPVVGMEGLRPDLSGDVVVKAIRVRFDDGRWALLDAEGTVMRFRAGSGTVDPAYLARNLRPGDQVLLFDGDARKGLLTKVLEVAVDVPELAVAASWVTYWRQVLAAAYRRIGSYGDLTSELHERGCSVQAQTVRLWVIGVTIGPDDEEDVRRVALATGDEVLLGQHREVCRAMRSLRGAHVRLGQRLSEMARRVGAAAAAGRLAADEVIDERTGLTAADFEDSLDIVTVREIEPVGEVPYLLVGRLNQADEEEA